MSANHGGGARAASLLAAVALLLASATASGHTLAVHQHITRDAGTVWAVAPAELTRHLAGGGPVDALGAAAYAAGDDAVTGSADEDQEFNYLVHCAVLSFLLTGSGRCEFGPRHTRGFFEHFWDPDRPDAGGLAAYDQGLEDPTINGGERLASSYRKAQELWDTRVICRYAGRDRHGASCPVDRDEAYYWLGRVAHLLEDLTVPAHVHGARHDPAAARFGGVDPFEAFVASQYEAGGAAVYLALATLGGGAYAHEALPGLDGFPWAQVHPDPTDLFRLFWYTAQKTQYYAAAGGPTLARPGDDGTYRRPGDPGVARFDPPLWTAEGLVPVAGPADVPSALPDVAGALVPHALRAVAGLYRLFWHETHAIELSVNGSRLGPGDLLTVALAGAPGVENTGDLYLAVEDPQGRVWLYDGRGWGAALVPAWPDVTLTGSAVTAFSTRLDAAVAEGAYTFHAVLVASGADPGDPGNWLGNLAQASFTLAGPAPPADP